MPKCIASTAAGNPCKLNARKDHTTCRYHAEMEWFIHQRDRMWEDMKRDLERGMQPLILIMRIHDAYEAGFLNHTYWVELRDWVWAWVYENRPAPLAGLAALAADKQNVHTTVVVQQTNAGVQRLLNEAATCDLDVEAAFYGWRDEMIRRVNATSWDNETQVRQVHALYKNACEVGLDLALWLDVEDDVFARCFVGAWSLIQKSTHKDELILRLYQECEDAIGMCREGHLSRLANVFVGFEDAFVLQVSPGEQLQEAMASIAAKEIPVEEKIALAHKAMDELHVPHERRTSWLAAF